MILLTGSTGFVGRKILKELLNRGEDVVVVTRNSSSEKLAGIDRLNRIVQTQDLFEETEAWWGHVLDGIDTIIHAAWYAEPGKYLQSLKNLDCLTGTLRMARSAAEHGVRRFVGIGTCFEYDVSNGVLSTDSPLGPSSVYAAAKASTYLTLSQMFRETNVEFAWCRLFYLYGDGEDPRRLVASIRNSLQKDIPVELSSGNQIRDFLDVERAAEMITDTSLGNEQGAFNISSGVPVTVRQLAERIADEYGRRDLLLFGCRKENAVDPPCVVGIRN